MAYPALPQVLPRGIVVVFDTDTCINNIIAIFMINITPHILRKIRTMDSFLVMFACQYILDTMFLFVGEVIFPNCGVRHTHMIIVMSHKCE
jgi:hypothetical protein